MSYVLNEFLYEPQFGITADHAYWLSGMRVRDPDLTYGMADAVSHGLTDAESAVGPVQASAGGSATGVPPHTRLRREWSDKGTAPGRNALTLTFRNVSAVTVDVDRARLGCDAAVSLDSDGPVRVVLRGNRCSRTLVQAPQISSELS